MTGKARRATDNPFSLPRELVRYLEGIQDAPEHMQGGQGKVYLARWKKKGDAYNGREVVVKEFRSVRDERVRVWPVWERADEQYVTKLVFADSLRKPSSGDRELRDYEVTAFQPAGALRQLMPPGEPQPLTFATQVLDLLARALHHVHSELGGTIMHRRDSLVHGDLKPENILVNSEGGPLRLLLVDFGLARVRGGKQERLPFEGTARYASPERHWDNWTPATDWWSLGVLMLELLCGRYPFQEVIDRAWVLPDGGRAEPQTRLEHREILRREADEMIAFLQKDIDVREYLEDRDDIDARWIGLLTGLLQRLAEKRWGWKDVLAWLNHEEQILPSPPRPDHGPAAPVVFEFAGDFAANPKELARLMRNNWSEAAVLFSSARVEELAEWAATLAKLGANVPFRLDRGLRDLGNEQRPDLAVTKAIGLLDPRSLASFRGLRLDQSCLAGTGHERQCRGLARTAREALQGWRRPPGEEPGTNEYCQAVEALWSTKALREMPGSARDDLNVIDDEWRRLYQVADAAMRTVPEVKDHEIAPGHLLAMLLLAVTDHGYTRDLMMFTSSPDHLWKSEYRMVGWFNALESASHWPPGAATYRTDAAAFHAVMVLAAPRLTMQEARVSKGAREAARMEIQRALASPSASRRDRIVAQARAIGHGERRRGIVVAAVVGLYGALVVIAGIGVALGTGPGPGLWTATFLAFLGAWLPAAARIRPARLSQALLGGWLGGVVGLLIAGAAGAAASLVTGPSAAWPTFWVGWVAAAIVGAVWGAAE